MENSLREAPTRNQSYRPDHLNGHIKQVHTSERPHKCQVWVGSSSGLPPLESLPSDLPSWDFAQPALWRSSHSVPDTAFSLSLKKSFPALENLGPAHSSNTLFCPAPPGYLRQGWTAPEGSRAFPQWPVG
ncbi:POZ/BTB and AT hook containing zinc finger 1 [Rhinolophus ferrumequinum]|uniref:POZ/BTB and AT hook containing zinc finger 1 n=1 Tax=Rhinolophus ferrumequinum TaxID=59479 RepID=A0A7J7RQ85_RHIFE|nr:POZ/BTB and AT hook containing zinc finger 1 [Rhinolophus ferrumequinum]